MPRTARWAAAAAGGGFAAAVKDSGVHSVWRGGLCRRHRQARCCRTHRVMGAAEWYLNGSSSRFDVGNSYHSSHTCYCIPKPTINHHMHSTVPRLQTVWHGVMQTCLTTFASDHSRIPKPGKPLNNTSQEHGKWADGSRRSRWCRRDACARHMAPFRGVWGGWRMLPSHTKQAVCCCKGAAVTSPRKQAHSKYCSTAGTSGTCDKTAAPQRHQTHWAASTSKRRARGCDFH
jgi:hypothetical protein